MTWLFERTVEFAAWVSLIVAWASAVLALVWFVRWCGTLPTEPDHELIRDSAKAAGAFVGFAFALGGLACVDRFLFDSEESLDV